jgi:hypothetical protein
MVTCPSMMLSRVQKMVVDPRSIGIGRSGVDVNLAAAV